MEVFALVSFYCRSGQYGHVRTACSEALRTRGSDPALLFWKAAAPLLEQGTAGAAEAMRALQPLSDKKEARLAALLATAHAHAKARLVDSEAVDELQRQAAAETERASAEALQTAAEFCLHTRVLHERAADLARRAAERHQSDQAALAGVRALQGWVQLLGSGGDARDAAKHFDAALKLTAPRYVADALLGQARCSAAQRRFSEALEMLSQAAVLHPWLAPLALAERARVLLASGEWELAAEAAGKALAKDPQCIDALLVAALHALTREGASQAALARVADLTKALDATEPKNAVLLARASRIIASVSGRNTLALQAAQTLANRALVAAPEDSAVLCDCGRQALLSGDASGALSHFRQAIKRDEGNVGALYGVVRALLLAGNLSEAEQQLEFLSELQASTSGKTPELLFLSALVRAARPGHDEEANALMTEAVDLHFKSLRGLPLSEDYFVAFDADMLVDAARQYLTSCGDEPLDPSAPVPEALSRARKLLEIVSKAIPGHLECLFHLSRSRMISGELDRALSSAGQCIKLSPTFAEAYILVAQLHLSSQQPKQALQALENAVSHNFRVRSNAMFYLLRARAHAALGDHESSFKALEQAFELPAVSSVIESLKIQPSASAVAATAPAAVAASTPADATGAAPSIWVVASLQIERAQSLAAQGRAKEGRELLQDVARVMRGTALEVRIVIAQAQIMASVGDSQSALRVLSLIDASHPAGTGAYIRAQAAAATIHLAAGDRRQHVRCYERLVEAVPTLQTQLMLAEALTRIQEPENAVEVYRAALQKVSTPGERQAISRRIGQALLATHEYNRAAEHLEAAHKADPNDLSLAFDLAELYARMRRIPDAERIAKLTADRLLATTTAGGSAPLASGAPREQATVADLSTLARLNVLLARIHGEIGGVISETALAAADPKKTSAAAPEHLMKAREVQLQAIIRAKAEQPDMLGSAKQAAADISFKLAEFYSRTGTAELQARAQAFFLETLQHNDQHMAAMLALASLHLSRGEIDLCQHQVSALLRAFPGNEEGLMMNADLMLRKGDADSAVFNFQQLLQRKPDHYHALVRLIGLLRAAGNLSHAPRFIANAERSCSGSLPPGLQFCKGLLARLRGNSAREALECFNAARSDPEWGQLAREHMVRIYLGEDTVAYMGGGSGTDLDGDDDDEKDKKKKKSKSKDKGKGKDKDGAAAAAAAETELNDSVQQESTQNVNSARELLRELCGGRPAELLEHKVLECYCAFVSRRKADVEPAIATLMQMVAGDSPDPSPLLALAVGHLALRQIPKARNHLRRLVKMDWRADRANEFERGWLLLSRIYVQGSKYDLAQELLKQCLARNKSCARAWELQGYIAEKESSYRDAADDYELAWKLLGETDPAIGFKLAFNYLKGKRYVEAISVCHKVLALNPAYPKIRKDILDRARSSLRP